MKMLFVANLVLFPLLTMGLEEDRQSDISERQKCYVPGQCQEYSVNFQKTLDVDLCHKFCGQNEDCKWWSFEPEQSLCVLFKNCTDSGAPDTVPCPNCISGERLCPARQCHEAVKCEGHFVDSFKIAHLEDCIKACRDSFDKNGRCNYYTLEKTHNHCLLYEECEDKSDCDTCASGPVNCYVGYHDATPCKNDSECPTWAGYEMSCFGADESKGISGFCYSAASF